MRKTTLVLRFGLPCLWALTTLGCSSSNSQTAVPESLTLVAVDPSDFMDGGACGTRLESYVATLFDATGSSGISDAGVSSARFFIASTPPKPCTDATVFSNVVPGHAYEVDLRGYRQPATELTPAFASNKQSGTGSSAMLLTADSSYVTPAANATCHGWTDNDGRAQPGYAYGNVTVTLRECSLLGAETP